MSGKIVLDLGLDDDTRCHFLQRSACRDPTADSEWDAAAASSLMHLAHVWEVMLSWLGPTAV